MKTDVLPADSRRFSWSHGPIIGWFEPSGRMRVSTRDAALLRKVADDTEATIQTARVVAGLVHPAGTRRTVEDVAAIVRRERALQVGEEATVTVARTGTVGSGLGKRGSQRIVTEDAAEVFIVNLPGPGAARGAFEREVAEIAEKLAAELGRDEVVVQFQRSGMQARVIGVGPP